MSWFRCNCNNTIEGLDILTAAIYIDQLTLNEVDHNNIVTLSMEITVVLEALSLNRELDSVYLFSISNNQTQALMDDHFVSIDANFNIPLSNKDDSSRQFHLDVHMSIPAGLYKLYYIRRINKSKYIVLGGSFPLQIQFINNHEISFSSPSLKQVESFSKKPFKDITNVKVSSFQQSNHTESSQDEGKHCVAFNNLTPKFKQ